MPKKTEVPDGVVNRAQSCEEISEEIQAQKPKKTEVPDGVVNSAQSCEEISEEIQAQMPKKTEVPDGVANSAQSCEEIAEEIQAQMLKKTEVLTDVVLDHGGPNQLEGRDRAPDGLLDSGASHPMRSATSVEYSGGSPVSVTLAGEGVRVLRQNDQGTILVEKEQGQVQPIVPRGALIQDLGYTLHWGPSFLKLTHPTKGPVKVRINNNCPEVAACDALAMIRELEMSQVNSLNQHVETLRARLEVLKLEEKRPWTELLKEFVATGKRGVLLKTLMSCPITKDLPTEVHSLMLEDFNVDAGNVYLKALPLTRKKGKALMNSNNWVVNLFMGDNDTRDPFRMIQMGGKTVLEVE